MIILRKQKEFANLKSISKTGKNILHVGSVVKDISADSKIENVGKDISSIIKSTSKQARNITGDAKNSSVEGPNTVIVQHLGGGKSRHKKKPDKRPRKIGRVKIIQGELFNISPEKNIIKETKPRKITGKREILIHEDRALDEGSNTVIGDRVKVRSLGDISREKLDPELNLGQYK